MVGSCNVVLNVISPHFSRESLEKHETGSYAESLSRRFTNKEQKYWYCPFNGKARLHFLLVLYYVGWIGEIN